MVPSGALQEQSRVLAGVSFPSVLSQEHSLPGAQLLWAKSEDSPPPGTAGRAGETGSGEFQQLLLSKQQWLDLCAHSTSQGARESVDSLGLFSTRDATGFQRITCSFQSNPFPHLVRITLMVRGHQHWLLACVLTGPAAATGQRMLRTFLPNATDPQAQPHPRIQTLSW